MSALRQQFEDAGPEETPRQVVDQLIARACDLLRDKNAANTEIAEELRNLDAQLGEEIRRTPHVDARHGAFLVKLGVCLRALADRAESRT